MAVALAVCYVFYVMEWNILGAILNPTAYLIYAASAATFLTFITAKYAYFQSLFRMGFDGLKELILKELKKGMNTIMSKICAKNGIAVDKHSKAI